MIIRRKLFTEIEKFLDSRQALVVTGMRRVGKTTLLNYFYEKIASPNKIFLDLEDPLNQEIFTGEGFESVRGALERRGFDFSQKGYVFLDEIQLVPILPSVVKYFYDHHNIKFFLTGSASFYLKNLFSESLAGRKYLFELFPLDFEEFIWFKGSKYQLPGFEEAISKKTHSLFAPLLAEYLEWGGMPEVVLVPNPREKQQLLRDVFSSYFQKEVEVLGDFRKNEVIRSLVLLLSARVGQKLDIQRISQELGVSRQTIYEYLDFLSGTYLISLIPALGKVDVALRKQRKVYFVDTGFFSFLGTPPRGSVFENSVYNNLRHWGKIFYFQKETQEVDFVAQTPSLERVMIEVKGTATAADFKKLRRISQKLEIEKFFVFSLDFSPVKEAKYLFQQGLNHG